MLIALAMPRSSRNVCDEASQQFYLTSTSKYGVARIRKGFSVLTYCFNACWCDALNLRDQLKGEVTHFAMQHTDIVPEHNWLDILIDELIRLDADVLSAVVAIKKGGSEETSTAVETDDPWLPRRLTLSEVYRLPESFCSDDIGAPLLLNTGLWVCRLDRPWVETVVFDSLNRITKDAKGVRHPQIVTEDWLFSRELNTLGGVRQYATRKVKVDHVGDACFSNYPHPEDQTETAPAS